MLKSIKALLSTFQIHVIFICIMPLIAMVIWHIFDNSLPNHDGSGYFFRSYSHAQHYFIADNNFFEATRKFFKHLFFERGMKPTLFPAIGLPASLLSFNDFHMGYLILNVFYLSIILFFSYLLFYEFSKNRIFAAISASIISMSPPVFDLAIDNMAEIGIILFIFPFFYYLYKSEYFTNKNHSYLFSISFALILSTRPLQAFLIIIFPIVLYVYSGYKTKAITSKNLITMTYCIFSAIVIIFTLPHLKNIGSSVFIEHMNNGDHSEQIYFLESLYYYMTLFLYSTFIFLNFLIYKKNKCEYLQFRNIKLNCKNHNNYFISSTILFLILVIIIWGWQFNDLMNWIYGATFGSMITGAPALNHDFTFLQRLQETIARNGFFTLYFLLFIFFLFLILNKFKLVFSNYIYIILSAIPIHIFLMMSAQSDPYRTGSGLVILFTVLLILMGSSKKYLNLVNVALALFLSFKILTFYDHHFSISKINYVDLYSDFDTDRNFGGGMFRHNINHGKSPTLLALDIIKNYHKKYNFKKVYVDGHSRLFDRHYVDSYKMRNFLEYHPVDFIVGDVNVPKYYENSYKMVEERNFDFMFLTNPLIHDDGSKEYRNKINYYLSCTNVKAKCNVSAGSLNSFRMMLEFVNKISNGTISETNWSLIDTIKIYEFDVFVLKLKKSDK